MPACRGSVRHRRQDVLRFASTIKFILLLACWSALLLRFVYRGAIRFSGRRCLSPRGDAEGERRREIREIRSDSNSSGGSH